VRLTLGREVRDDTKRAGKKWGHTRDVYAQIVKGQLTIVEILMQDDGSGGGGGEDESFTFQPSSLNDQLILVAPF
jgi:hypothetical protein